MTSRTCILVKPDGVCKGRIGVVVDRLERQDLRLIGLKMTRLSPSDAERFYQEHQGKPFYPGLIAFMTSAPIVAMAWQGTDAVAKARTAIGATDSLKAAPGSLRRDFGTDNRYNLVHGSDSASSAEREIQFFFKSEELYTYHETDWQVGENKWASRSPAR